MNKKRMSQNLIIKRHLESGYTITSKEAWERYHITRLSGRIYDLKRKYGLNIGKRMVYLPDGTRFAEYYLIEKVKEIK